MTAIRNEEREVMAKRQIKMVEGYMAANPEKCRGMIVGLQREQAGDYIYLQSPAGDKPKCSVCGKPMGEGTVVHYARGAGIPYWFCFTKSCAEQTQARRRDEIDAYRETHYNKEYAPIKAMGIPAIFVDKNIGNLHLPHPIKDSITTAFDDAEDLLISGPAGTGKTHLAVALLVGYGSKQPSRCQFINVSKMYMEIQELIKGEESYAEYLNLICAKQLVTLDDLGTGNITEHRKEILYYIINEREFGRKQTIITTNLTLENISDIYDERLASRIGAFTSITMPKKDHRRDR